MNSALKQLSQIPLFLCHLKTFFGGMKGFVLLSFYFSDLPVWLFQDKSSISIHTSLAISFCYLFCFWKDCEEKNSEVIYMGVLGLICPHNNEKNFINLKCYLL